MKIKRLISITLSGCLLLLSLAVPSFAVDEHTHIWSEYTYNNDASCTQAGTMTAYCIVDGCEEKDTVADPSHLMTEHNYIKTVVPATCTEEGYTLFVCSGCADSYKDSIVSPTGHHFGEWVSDENSTFFKNGTKTHHCNDCDETETVEDEGSAGYNIIFGTIVNIILPVIRDLISNLFGNL